MKYDWGKLGQAIIISTLVSAVMRQAGDALHLKRPLKLACASAVSSYVLYSWLDRGVSTEKGKGGRA